MINQTQYGKQRHDEIGEDKKTGSKPRLTFQPQRKPRDNRDHQREIRYSTRWHRYASEDRSPSKDKAKSIFPGKTRSRLLPSRAAPASSATIVGRWRYPVAASRSPPPRPRRTSAGSAPPSPSCAIAISPRSTTRTTREPPAESRSMICSPWPKRRKATSWRSSNPIPFASPKHRFAILSRKNKDGQQIKQQAPTACSSSP